jgi:hypothetical protein
MEVRFCLAAVQGRSRGGRRYLQPRTSCPRLGFREGRRKKERRSDRGLAGAYNVNILRKTLDQFNAFPVPVSYVAVGRKGRDMLIRRRKDVIADFSQLPTPPTFQDVSAIGFTDWQLEGPFAEWVHRHNFVAVDEQTSVTLDEVNLRLRSHPIWWLVGMAMWLGLPLLFAYRAWKTRRMLQ